VADLHHVSGLPVFAMIESPRGVVEAQAIAAVPGMAGPLHGQ
jgi:citrate lyase beta subunit